MASAKSKTKKVDFKIDLILSYKELNRLIDILGAVDDFDDLFDNLCTIRGEK